MVVAFCLRLRGMNWIGACPSPDADVVVFLRGLLACFLAKQAWPATTCAASIQDNSHVFLCCAHVICRSNVVTEDLDKLFVKKTSPARKADS